MVNVKKLHGKVVENEMSWSTLADKLNMNRSTLYRKLKPDGDKLTIKEVNKIVCEIGRAHV